MTYQNRRPHNRHNNKFRRNRPHHGYQNRHHDTQGDGQEYTIAAVHEVALSHLMQDKNLPQAIIDLQQQKEQLCIKMTAIKNRLTFGYSEPLNQDYIQLVRQDLALSCQINQRLLVL